MNVKERIYFFVKAKGITIKKFEEDSQLSNGYVSSMRKSLGEEKLNNVLKAFPELNRDWLLYGEGEMLKSSVNIENGDNSTQVIGDGNHVSAPSTLDKALDEIAAQRRLVEKAQEQMDRLIGVLEKMTEK